MRLVLAIAGIAVVTVAVVAAVDGQSRHDHAIQVAECASARAHIAADDRLPEPGDMYQALALWCKVNRL